MTTTMAPLGSSLHSRGHDRVARRADKPSPRTRDAFRVPVPPTARPRWLALARVVWLLVVLAAYTLLLSQAPHIAQSAFHDPTNQGSPASIPSIALSLADARHMRAIGLPVSVYAVALVAVTLVFHVIYATAGLLLFWRRADDLLVYLASLGLMLLPFGFAPMTLGALPLSWRWLIPLFAAIGNCSLILSGYLFPDGRFRPRWTCLLGAGVVVGAVVAAATPSSDHAFSAWTLVMFLGFALGVLPIQAYRYSALSDQVQRQQTKWVVWGMSVGVVGDIAARALFSFVLTPSWGNGALTYGVQNGLIMLAMIAIPVGVGVAILSSHLWDIDLVIHRTLVYSALSALLALIYAGANIVMQSLFHGLTGQSHSGSLTITVSTLLVAALTNPLRRWLQRIIDRRFYRKHFRRSQVLQAFANAMRHAVEIQQVNDHLLSVIEETMRPSHMSIWITSGSRRSTSHASTHPGLDAHTDTPTWPTDRATNANRRSPLVRDSAD